MATVDGGRARSGRWNVVLQVGQFVVLGLTALVMVGLATSVASRRVGEREAIVDARTTTLATAQGVVEPAVTDDLVAGSSEAIDRVGQVVEPSIAQGSIVRVKIWGPDGTIVYSDEPRLIGAHYSLGPEERESLTSGRIVAEVSDLSAPENRFERQYGKLLEVYLPIRTPSGETLLFEAYYRYDAVHAAGSRLWRSFAPISLGALLVLLLVQVPLAWSLARRLRQRQREREGLLRRAIDASEVERRRIAADLHDGVVQDLAGVSYALSGAARACADGAPIDVAETFEDNAETVRGSIKALRSLLVEIYPPNLETEGLDTALSDLLARTQGRGVVATLDTAGLRDGVPAPVAGLLYRATQEALRNTLNHAQATTFAVRVSSTSDRATLDVSDNGVGFDPDAGAAEGHVGLQGLEGLVADAGGEFDIRSAPGDGTRMHVEVPLQ
jgi:signal transduction histidine kinase